MVSSLWPPPHHTAFQDAAWCIWGSHETKVTPFISVTVAMKWLVVCLSCNVTAFSLPAMKMFSMSWYCLHCCKTFYQCSMDRWEISQKCLLHSSPHSFLRPANSKCIFYYYYTLGFYLTDYPCYRLSQWLLISSNWIYFQSAIKLQLLYLKVPGVCEKVVKLRAQIGFWLL